MTKTAIIRAALYARYSTDMQKASSIDDQERVCRAICKDRGNTVMHVFSDSAVSGGTDDRPGYRGLLRAIESGQVDVLVCEAIDRLGRDSEHAARLQKIAHFHGVDIVTTGGVVDDIHFSVNSLLSTMFLKNLAQKTQRGLEGRVLAGKSAGGLSYGYSVARRPLPGGTFTTGELAINAAEAAVVRRIFEDYAKGLSSRAIAVALNAKASRPRAAMPGHSRRFRATGSVGQAS